MHYSRGHQQRALHTRAAIAARASCGTSGATSTHTGTTAARFTCTAFQAREGGARGCCCASCERTCCTHASTAERTATTPFTTENVPARSRSMSSRSSVTPRMSRRPSCIESSSARTALCDAGRAYGPSAKAHRQHKHCLRETKHKPYMRLAATKSHTTYAALGRARASPGSNRPP